MYLGYLMFNEGQDTSILVTFCGNKHRNEVL